MAQQRADKEIRIIEDSLSAHKTARVRDFLKTHAIVKLHFTPTYSSWLNQVELCFGKIERDVIARRVFTSTHELKRKLMRYIREGNKCPKPIKWTYCDVRRRIRNGANSNVTVH